MNILQEKLDVLGLSVSSPGKLLELSSPEEEKSEWSGSPSGITRTGGIDEMRSSPPAFPTVFHHL